MHAVNGHSMNGNSAPTGNVSNGVSYVSPLRPARQKQRNEREQLCSLNDRLAQYIERVRELENERRQLVQRVCVSDSATQRASVKAAYQLELNDAHRLQAELEAEKLELQAQCQERKLEAEKANHRLCELEKSSDQSSIETFKMENQAQELNIKLDSSNRRKRYLETESEMLNTEKACLMEKREKVTKAAEEEKKQSETMQSELKTNLNKMTRERAQFENTLNETRLEINEETVERLNNELDHEYCYKLQHSLAEMRQELDISINKNRMEIAKFYEAKLVDLQNKIAQERHNDAELNKELHTTLQKKTSLEKFVNNYAMKLAHLESEQEKLAALLATSREEQAKQIAMRERQVQHLRDEMKRLMDNYHELVDVKVLLSKEMETFQSLLETEEKRLKIPSINEKSFNRTGRLIRKAKRTKLIDLKFVTKRGGRSDIQIGDLKTNNSSITVENLSDTDLPIGNWTLKCASKEKEISYKFHKKILLKAHSSLTVNSCDGGVVHNAHNGILVMKSQNWIIAEKCRISLSDQEGQEVCWGQLESEQDDGDDLYKEIIRSDPIVAKSRNCSIM